MPMGEESNQKRIERLKKIAGCLTDKALAEKFEVDAPQVTSWKKKGFHDSITLVIDFLLDQAERGRAPKAIYTAMELSEATGVSEAKIRRLAREGKLPGTEKRDGVWVFTEKSKRHLATKGENKGG